MKQRKRWLGLTIAPFALAMFAFAQPAHAIDYTSCAMMPNHVLGDANVTTSTACVISSDLLVDGSLTINAPSVDAKNVNTGGNITINTTTGNIKTFQLINEAGDIKLASAVGDVETRKVFAGNSVQITAGLFGGTANKIVVTQPIVINKTQTGEGHGNVILRARGNISTSTIRTDGELGSSSVKSGSIQIDANLSGAVNNAEFVIGGSAASNGVNGNLITRTTIGGGDDPIQTKHGIRITNGGFNSTGGITLTSMANIQVTASQSRAGWIELNAQNGILKLPSGKLNAEGANPLGTEPGPSYPGGTIYLFAKEIQTESGTIISTRQASSATPTVHQIGIGAETVTLKGVDGLRILNDGNGVSPYPTTAMVPQFGLISDSNLNLSNLLWSFPGGMSLSYHKSISVIGQQDNSPFRLISNGNNQNVIITGYPVIFNTGLLVVSATGAENHKIRVGYYGDDVDVGSLGISIDTSQNATFDVSGKDGNGGILEFVGDGFSISHSPILRLQANGPSTGDGDGGTVRIKATEIIQDTNARVIIEGNAATAGSGNAIKADLDSDDPQAIKIETSARSDITFGNGKGMISAKANGGAVGGDAGGIKIKLGPNSRVKIRNHQNSIQAAVLGDDGNAGSILLDAPDTQFDVFANPKVSLPVIVATAGTVSGEGGRVKLPHAAPDNAAIPINVHASIKVDGGPVRDPGIFDGSISLNNVHCRQRHTESTDWFASWWDCVTPDEAIPDSRALDSLEGPRALTGLAVTSQLTNTLSPFTKSVQIHAMKIIDDSNIFLGLNPRTGGTEVIFGRSITEIRFTAAFTTVNDSGAIVSSILPITTPTIMRSALVHELGHQLDYIWGNKSDDPAGFAGTRPAAFASMNAESCTAVWIDGCPKYDPSRQNSDILMHYDEDIADVESNKNFKGLPPKANEKRHKEMFARIFAYNYRLIGGYVGVPFLDAAYGHLPQMIDYVDSLVASPPTPVN